MSFALDAAPGASWGVLAHVLRGYDSLAVGADEKPQNGHGGDDGADIGQDDLVDEAVFQGLHFHRQVLDVLLGGDVIQAGGFDHLDDALGLLFGKIAADKLLERIMRVDDDGGHTPTLPDCRALNNWEAPRGSSLEKSKNPSVADGACGVVGNAQRCPSALWATARCPSGAANPLAQWVLRLGAVTFSLSSGF